MKQIYRILMLLFGIALLSCSPLLIFAHPGNTDSNGGHYNRSTGEYHYHHGYPAHQHENGICPYNYEVKKRQSFSEYSYEKYASKNGIPNQTFKPDVITSVEAQKQNRQEGFKPLPCLLLITAIIYIIIQILKKIKHDKMTRAKESNEYDYYFKAYAFYEPKDFVNIPNGVYFRNGLPATDGSGAYGLYTVYTTPTGTKYHQARNCIRSSTIIQRHICSVHIPPCSKCAKRTIPNITWYYEYRRIYNIKKKYNIP